MRSAVRQREGSSRRQALFGPSAMPAAGLHILPCVLALLELRPRFGLELVRGLAAADGLLTSDGTVYPLLGQLRDAGLVTSEWRDEEGERARRYYSLTEAGRQSLTGFRADWTWFSAAVGGRAEPCSRPWRDRGEGRSQ
jgi:PadR family transcriptional regulator, regulatory protein PadR